MRDTTSNGKRLLLIFWILASAPWLGRAQQDDLAFETLPLDQGAATHVSCILQDRTGFVWVATWSGLHRYDGYTFVAYRHNPDDTASIADNRLSTLYEDREGTLWVGSWLGLERFNRETGTFRHFTPNPQAPRTDPSNNVSTVCEDTSGGFWVGCWGGLYRFDRSLEKFTPVLHDSSDPGSISHNSVGAICKSKDGSLWFGTAAGLDTYSYATGKFKRCLRNQEGWKAILFNVVAAYWVTSILEDDAGTLWLGTQGGLVSFNPRDGSSAIYRYDPKGPDTWLNPRNNIAWISLDPLSGILWIVTEHGLFRFDRVRKTFSRLMEKVVTCLCIERSGTLLLGSDIGLQRRNLTTPPFRKYAMGDVGIGIAVDKDGDAWVMGYRTAWHKFDTRKQSFVPYSFGQFRLAYVYRPDEGGGMVFLRPDGGTLVLDSLGRDIGGLPSSMREFLMTASNTTNGRKGYYLGTNRGGVYLLDLRKGSAKEVLNLQQPIYFLQEDRLGFLWVTTMMGRLIRYNQEMGTVAEYLPDPRNPSSWCGEPVNCPYEDSKGRLWFATRSGLHRWDPQTNGFTSFTDKQGLPGNNVRGIHEDQHGNYWVSTTYGISRFDPETGRSKHYDASYGLDPAADILFGGADRDKDGVMYFGGANGLTVFHPDSIRDNLFVPPVVITSFSKFDNPSPLAREIRLPYDENFLSFEFAALSYISPERNQYAYMMQGVDRDWVYCGTRRYASYPNLDPGDYVFRVKGSNNEGVWNEAGASIAIVIAPPWWKTTWAYILYSAILLGILYLTWKMQVKRIRIVHEYQMSRFEAEKLHEVDQMKSRFFANISHEFRTPLTLILGPAKQIIAEVEEGKIREELNVIYRNASKLLGLVNQLLDVSRLEAGTMKLQTVPQNIVPLLKAMTMSFASYAERKGIALTFKSGSENIRAYIDQDKIEKVITNILSNAFKFTPEGGTVDVAVGEEQDCVAVRISDTGIGIPADRIPKIFDRFYQVDGSHTRAQEGTGIGLSLAKELIELHKGSIEVESTEGQGTTFMIRLPLGKEHLKLEEICEPEQEGGNDPFVPEEVAYQEAISTEKREAGFIIETEKPLLLIVEDNADVRHYIHDNVKKEYRILEAVDGEDGWDRTIEHMPDVIVSDVMMPKMDGFRLCEKLKTDERTSHIPVILLTARASSRDKIEGYETGADDYIVKPFEAEEVNARIRNLIEQRKRIHEHFRKHGLFEIDGKKITPVDQKFLQKAVLVITEHMSDAGFGVEPLAAEMAVSTSVLLKKVEALVGEPPIELIKRTRLNRAAQLIDGRFGNISEIALEVGFTNPSYFAECFRKQFGVTPSHYHRSPADR